MQLKQELELSTVFFSWKLCLGESSCVEKQIDMLILFNSSLRVQHTIYGGPFVPIQFIEMTNLLTNHPADIQVSQFSIIFRNLQIIFKSYANKLQL